MNYIGDIRLCNPERDKGKPLHEIIDFEVWDGERWVHARESETPIMVEVSSSC